MANNKLVSLIVPIYNTKRYLDRCLQSIIKQDYTNIEIILVNDGSTDNPEEIISNYINKYKNVMYIYQNNKGVGAARNAGIAKASGNYISFVDSDDFIFTNYCSYLLDIIDEAEIAVAGSEKYVGDQYIKSKVAPKPLIVNSVEAIKYMLLGKYSTRPAWGKLFKREIVENISFIEGHVFEEICYTVDSFVQASKIIYADKNLYSYRVREGSIMTSGEERQIRDLTLAVEHIYKTIVNNQLYNLCDVEFNIWLANVIIMNTHNFSKYNVNIDLYKDCSNRLIDLYNSLGGLQNMFKEIY
jgi:glycosyltransferase involved in cell wall biosynthesis